MTALRDRPAPARAVDRALAEVLPHGERSRGCSTADRRASRQPRCLDELAALDVTTPGIPTAGDVDFVTLKVRAERQRIASALHDEVSQLLFAMAARVQRSRDLDGEDPIALRATVETLAEQLQETQDRLRRIIRACGPATATDTVPVAIQRDLDDFTARTGTAAHLLVRGRPAHLPPSTERVILNCLRQALFNIERHARASLVIVTLEYRPDRLCLTVQDDGLGLPEGFEPRAIPADGHHWGFTSMAEQVERLGGSVALRRALDKDLDNNLDEGTTDDTADSSTETDTRSGTLLRVQLPRLAETL